MFIFSQRSIFLALVAAAALLAPSDADTMTTTSTTDGGGASDEPVDSGLECNDDFLRDGACDSTNNNEACGYDGGDCCECTCSPRDFNCGGSYDCMDPDAACFGDDDGTGGVQTDMDLGDDDASAAEEVVDDADADDSAAGITPFSPISTGIAAAAAAGAAAIFAGCAW